MSDFPPAPWHLFGRACLGVFVVPRDDLPTVDAPGVRPLTVLGRGLVGAAFFSYEEPSVLTYGEVLFAVLVRRGLRPMVSITHIWVDSPASRDGGRALWGVPKDLASFTFGDDTFAAVAEGRTLVTARTGPARVLPVRVPVHFSIVQRLAGRAVRTPVTGSASLGLARTRWTTGAPEAFGFLAARTPLLSVVLRRFRLTFGSA